MQKLGHFSTIALAMILIVIAAGGSYFMFLSHAATPYVAIEAENGTVTTPAVNIADTAASSGTAVSFKGAVITPPPSGVPIQQTGYWWSTLESVPLGVAQCPNGQCNPVSTALKQHWTWFGQPGQENDYGYPEVVSAANEGLPAPPAGDRVLKLHHPKGDPAVHRKLFKTFTTQNWPAGQLVADGQSPADASARYIAYQYFPSSKFSMTSHGYVNMLQFKETIQTQAGFQQDPYWVIYTDTGGPYKYTSHLVGMNGHRDNGKKYDFSQFMDRWVKWEFRVYQDSKIEWYMDDKLMDTAYDSESQVGPQCKVGGTYNGSPITACKGWVFGAGNYNSLQALSGAGRNEPDYNYMETTGYVDLATVQPL